MTYKYVCEQGHEPENMSVEAENDDLAMEKMMAACKTHLSEKHGEMTMSDDEMRDMIKNGWTKE